MLSHITPLEGQNTALPKHYSSYMFISYNMQYVDKRTHTLNKRYSGTNSFNCVKSINIVNSGKWDHLIIYPYL